jgi:FkbH-like protein
MSGTISDSALLSKDRLVKCVVWDLDNTLWDGILLEDDHVVLRQHVVEVIRTLDERGVLHSIASKNDFARARAKLETLSLWDYFLYPKITWNSKVESLKQIVADLNIGLDSLAFVDDQPFELAEVAFALPQVLCVGVDEVLGMVARPEFSPRFITDDSRRRRTMYVSDILRKNAEQEFVGPQEAFLATLEMKFKIALADQVDLQRAEELTLRTNQLNTTGYTYLYHELDVFRRSDKHILLVAELEDRFGLYGKIGLALIERQMDIWLIKLLLMSCRVISRGGGTILLYYLMNSALLAGVRLQAEFIGTERNRMMYVTYKFAGFKEVERIGNRILLECPLSELRPWPAYITVELPDIRL